MTRPPDDEIETFIKDAAELIFPPLLSALGDFNQRNEDEGRQYFTVPVMVMGCIADNGRMLGTSLMYPEQVPHEAAALLLKEALADYEKRHGTRQ